MEKLDNKIIEIFSGTSWEAGMIKSQLENVGITAFIKDEIMGTLNPWHTAPGGVDSIKVTILDCDIDKAKLIIDEYNKSREVK